MRETINHLVVACLCVARRVTFHFSFRFRVRLLSLSVTLVFVFVLGLVFIKGNMLNEYTKRHFSVSNCLISRTFTLLFFLHYHLIAKLRESSYRNIP